MGNPEHRKARVCNSTRIIFYENPLDVKTNFLTYRLGAPLNRMNISRKSINQPDETRKFEKGKIDITNVGDTSIGIGTFEPGWKWSNHVKPLVGGNSCQIQHTMYVISGKMHVRMDDGSEQEFSAGDTGVVPPGHDAWVVGNEKFVAVDFTGARNYAK